MCLFIWYSLFAHFWGYLTIPILHGHRAVIRGGQWGVLMPINWPHNTYILHTLEFFPSLLATPIYLTFYILLKMPSLVIMFGGVEPNIFLNLTISLTNLVPLFSIHSLLLHYLCHLLTSNYHHIVVPMKMILLERVTKSTEHILLLVVFSSCHVISLNFCKIIFT